MSTADDHQSSADLRGAVFFDRDGTLIQAPVVDGSPSAIRSVDQLALTRGAEALCRRLEQAGVPMYVVTNQPDVERGLTTRFVVEQINSALAAALPVDGVEVSWTDDDDDPRRKPNPGMLEDLAAEHDLDLHASVMIGDRWKDVEAGRRAGTRTVFIDRGLDEPGPTNPDLVVAELDEAADWIVEHVTG